MPEMIAAIKASLRIGRGAAVWGMGRESIGPNGHPTCTGCGKTASEHARKIAF
jgi:hypothetical protein